jgi:hypothetical protein
MLVKNNKKKNSLPGSLSPNAPSTSEFAVVGSSHV